MLISPKTITWIAILPVILILPKTLRAQGRPVEIAPREEGSYQAYLTDEESIRWNASWTLEQSDKGPPARYIVQDELQGRFGEDNLEQTRKTQAVFLLDEGKIKMQHSTLIVTNPQGETIFFLEKIFDYTSGVVRTRAKKENQEQEKLKEFEMGDLLVDNKEIVSFLRGFPFPLPNSDETQEREIKFKFLNEEPDTYSVIVEYEGIEEVITPAGKFACHKLRLIPDFGILTFLGRILAPDILMWFTVSPPHFWVKYRGLEGNLDTPAIISELTKFHCFSLKSPEDNHQDRHWPSSQHNKTIEKHKKLP